jgi:hypothetical protein
VLEVVVEVLDLLEQVEVAVVPVDLAAQARLEAVDLLPEVSDYNILPLPVL